MILLLTDGLIKIARKLPGYCLIQCWLILINSLQSFGFNLMATSNYHWLLSFSRAEQVLLSNIDEDGGCRRKCYRVVRQLKEDVWCPGSKPVITAYHLQVPAQPKQPLYISPIIFPVILVNMAVETPYCLYIQKEVYTLSQCPYII